MFSCNCGCNDFCSPRATFYCVPWPFPACPSGAVSITSPANNSVVGPTPVITGTTAPGATVVAIGNEVVATATADSTGAFTMTPTLPLGMVTLTFLQFRPGCAQTTVSQLTLNVQPPLQ